VFSDLKEMGKDIQHIDMRGVVDVKETLVSLAALAVIEQQKRERQNHEALEIVLQQ
jgi:hypothetical protein